MAVVPTSSRSADEVQNILFCGVCKKTFNEPKILTCSHTFCKACLKNLVKRNDDDEGKFDCPTCKATTTLKPNETVAGLPNNEFILKLLTDEFLLKLLNAFGPNRQKEAAVCSFCQKESAITVCMQCEMLFCHECYTLHERFPANKNHTLLSVSEVINPDERKQTGTERVKCAGHEDAAVSFYCEPCAQLICIKCVASIHTKPDHSCVAIHEVFQKQQDDVKSKCATINTMLVEGKKALETVNSSKAKYDKTAKDIKAKHVDEKKEMMKTVEDHIEKVFEKKIKEVDDVYHPACQKFSCQSEVISSYLQKVEGSLQRGNDVLENSKLEALLSAQKEIEDDIQMLQNEKPQNLTSFQVQLANTESCTKKLRIFTVFTQFVKSLMPDTQILKNEENLSQCFLDFVGDRSSALKLCYSASLHGWSSQDFHKLCDGKAPTVVLVKVGNWIFGGYTDQTWNGGGQYKNSYSSFLFSLRNPNNIPPFKCPIKSGKNSSAIYCHPSYGATFGGGHDIHISNNANTNQYSYSNLGHTYQPPPGYQYGSQQTQSLLAGSNNFQPTEVEVFY